MRLSFFLVAVFGAALLPVDASWSQSRGFGGSGDYAELCRIAAEEERGDPQSLRACNEALQSSSLGTRDRAATLANRCAIFVNMKAFERAVEDCNRSIALVPTAGVTYVNRGAARLGQKRYQEALDDVDKGLALHTTQAAKAWYNRGQAHEGLNDLTAAAEDYRRALEIRPDWDLPKERLAVVLGNMTVK